MRACVGVVSASPMTVAGGDLLFFSHGYVDDVARTPALRGMRD